MESINPIIYTRLSRRLKAVMVDTFVLILSIVTSIFLVGQVGIENKILSITMIVVFSLSIEPFFVRFTGASIGHHVFGVRIRHSETDKNISLINSYLRVIFKLLVGTISLITVMSSRKHQALHDMISRSIVVLKNPQDIPECEHESERVLDKKSYIYPSKVRRILVSLSYITVIIILDLLIRDTFINGSADRGFDLILSVSTIIIIFSLAAFGMQGQLYGCKRIRRDASAS